MTSTAGTPVRVGEMVADGEEDARVPETMEAVGIDQGVCEAEKAGTEFADDGCGFTTVPLAAATVVVAVTIDVSTLVTVTEFGAAVSSVEKTNVLVTRTCEVNTDTVVMTASSTAPQCMLPKAATTRATLNIEGAFMAAASPHNGQLLLFQPEENFRSKIKCLRM